MLKTVGNKTVELAQRALYERLLRTKYEGRPNIPPHTNFIVAANHTSHLDMGLVKMALGDAGEELVALAAADYFFDTQIQARLYGKFHQPGADGTNRIAETVAASCAFVSWIADTTR